MRVAELWRYPVKSFLGEQVESAAVDDRGLVGDRAFAVVDGNGRLGSGKTTRRFRMLRDLFAYSARTEGGVTVVRSPLGGRRAAGDPRLDAELSERYGRPLRVLPEAGVSHFDAGAVHLLTTASLRWLAALLDADAADPRRFRPNVLIDAEGSTLLEDEWLDRTVRIGDVVLRVRRQTVRCGMPHFRQAELGRRPDILRRLVEENGQCLGVYADVVRRGILRAGDPVSLA